MTRLARRTIRPHRFQELAPHPVLRVVTVPARGTLNRLRRFWPLLLMIGGAVIVATFLIVQQVLSEQRAADVGALAGTVATQNTALASAGLPTVDPSTVVSGTSNLPTTVTSTTTVTSWPALPPAVTEVLPGALVTMTVTANGVPTTVTAPAGSPVTITQSAGPPLVVTAPGTVSTVTTTVSEPAAPAVTVTEPGPVTTVTETTTEPAPPPVTVTVTETTTATTTVTEPAPPAGPDPEGTP